jgi:hypothetical protein
MPLCKTNAKGEKVGLPWHLNKEEAVVLLGITPPEVQYFGLTNYLYEHTYPQEFEIDESVKPLSACWGKDAPTRRCDVFASLGDALNHGNLMPNRTGVGVYNQPFAMVIAPSMTVFNATSSLIKSSGIGVVNSLPLPGSILNLGFGEGKDTFGPLLRTAFPSDADAYKAWIDAKPFILLRVTPTTEESDRINSDGNKLYPKPRYCALGGPGSGSDACPKAVRQEWFDLGYTVIKDKGEGHVYLDCEDSPSVENPEGLKASCKPEECGGKQWCFVKNNCRWCKEDSEAKLSCPTPTPSDYCLTPRSTVPEAGRVGLTMERLRGAQQAILDKLRTIHTAGSWSWLFAPKSATTDFTAGVPDSGYMCLKLGQKCQGDSRDTYYPVSAELVQNALMAGAIHSKFWHALGWDPLTKQEMAKYQHDQYKRASLTTDKEDALVVVGVIHSATKASQYSSLSLYDLWRLQGTHAVSDTELVGSADEYLRGTDYEDLAPYLYAMRYTRGHCDGHKFCVDVPVQGELGIPEATPLLFIERMYYDPITHVGIDPSAAVAARIIHMTAA